MRFIVAAPPYRNSSAGCRVLHRLCHLLREIGELAFVATNAVNRAWNTPYSSVVTANTVVVYPEVIHGNPTDAERVVRYVLNHPGLLGGTKVYSDSEMVWYYDEWLRDSTRNATTEDVTGRRLFINAIEPEYFWNNPLTYRDKTCFYVGKARGITLELPGYTEITSKWPATRMDLGNLLRRTKVLYSYDDCTALLEEAVLCGAKAYITGLDGIETEYAGAPSTVSFNSTEAVERFARACKARWE